MFPSVRSLPRFAALSALLCASAFADTITLTTGEKLEGKVIRETDTEVTVEVKVSASIKDEQAIPKNTITKIDKEQPDEEVWPTIKNIKLGQNSLPEAQYEALTRPLQGFINEFPKSAHVAEAKQILDTINAEKERVVGGEVRFGQKWLTKEEVDKERYQIGGMLTLQFQRSQRDGNDLIGSLNTFDQFEKTYPGSASFPDGVDTARETLTTLKATVDRVKANLAVQLQEFNKGVTNASPTQKPELLAARQKELTQADTALAAAEKAKVWPPIMPRSDKALDALAKKITTEAPRISRIDTAKLRQAQQLAVQAQKQIADKDPTATESLIKALQLSSTNELAKRLQPEAMALKATAAAAAAATPVPATPAPKATPEPSTPRPHATPAQLAGSETVEKDKPFFLTPGGIVIILVLLGLGFAGWTIYKKISSRANDLLE